LAANDERAHLHMHAHKHIHSRASLPSNLTSALISPLSVLFPTSKDGTFTVSRREEDGGDVSFDSYEAVEVRSAFDCSLVREIPSVS
jgi:hypothetical protein